MSRQTKKTKEIKSLPNFSMQEVTELLLKKAGIKEGFYISHIVPQVRGGFVDINEDENEDKKLTQGIIIALECIELKEVPEDMPLAVDASQLT